MSTDPIKRELEGRARRALVSYALFRWESAVIIGLTILLAVFYPRPFPWWNWYFWVVMGIVAEVLIFYTSLTDPETARRVVAEMLRERYDVRQLRQPAYRQQFEKALDYRARIEKAIDETSAGLLRDRLERAGRGVDEWIGQIFQLAKRLDGFAGNEVIARDLKTVPAELKDLEARLRLEDDPAVQVELVRAIDQKRAQLKNLQQLQNTLEGAQVRLESTLTALGTVYSQMLLVAAKGDEGATAERLAADIRDQTASLQDLIETMDQVLERK